MQIDICSYIVEHHCFVAILYFVVKGKNYNMDLRIDKKNNIFYIAIELNFLFSR